MNRNMGALTWAQRETDMVTESTNILSHVPSLELCGRAPPQRETGMDKEPTDIHSHVPCWGYMVIAPHPAPRETEVDIEQTNTLETMFPPNMRVLT